jgi:hypothetical protein
MKDDRIPVISLIRFSDDQQIDDDRAGIPGQRLRIEAGVALHNLNIIWEEIVIDVSGKHVAGNLQFQHIFAALKSGEAKGVIVAEQSRLVRPQYWQDFAILDHLKRNHCCLYTPTERIDANTQAGWYTLTVGGMVSGGELQNMVDRFQRGKRIFHQSGRWASSDAANPRGVDYIRTRDPKTGKVVGFQWRHDGIDSERMRKAFGLLISANLSFEEIAARIGGGWTGKGVKDSLQNPIWISLRRYQYASGEEYTPTRRDGKPGKKRRHQIKLAEPMLVDISPEALGEAGLPRLVSKEVFERAQSIIAEQALHFRKSKEKNAGRMRHLASGGILRCACGEPLYTRYDSHGGSDLDAYYCASSLKGAKCGARSMRRIVVDSALRRILTECLLNVAFLKTVLAGVAKKAAQPADASRAKLEAKLAKLERGRKELIMSMTQGDITRTEFKEAADQNDRERRDLLALLPAPPTPDADAKYYLEAIIRAFAEFDMLPLSDQREILRRAAKEIVIDARRTPVIPSITLSGGFLSGFRSGANSRLPSRSRCLRQSPAPESPLRRLQSPDSSPVAGNLGGHPARRWSFITLRFNTANRTKSFAESVLRRVSLYAIDNQDVQIHLPRPELQPELFLHRGE